MSYGIWVKPAESRDLDPGGSSSSSVPSEIEMTPRSTDTATEDAEPRIQPKGEERSQPESQSTSPPTIAKSLASRSPDLASATADRSGELNRAAVGSRSRLTSTASEAEAEASSYGQQATVFATLIESSRRGGPESRSPLTAEEASSDEQLDFAEPDAASATIKSRASALIGLQRMLENKKEALHRLIAKASEDEKQQEAVAGEQVERREELLQAEHARLRRLLCELGQMSQEMRELNQQLETAENNYGKELLGTAAPAEADPKDALMTTVSQIAEVRQELAEERRRLFRALAELEDRNGQIEQHRRELDALAQRLGGEDDVMRLQQQLATERQSASSLASKLASEKEKSEELREQLRSLLEARKVDHGAMEASEVRLAAQAQELARIRLELCDRDAKIGELQEQLRGLTAARQHDTEQHGKQTEAMRARLDDAAEQVRRLTAAHLEEQRHRQMLEVQEKTVRQREQDLRREFEEKSIEIASLKAQVQGQGSASKRAAERCNGLAEQVKSVQAQCLELKKQLDAQVAASKVLKQRLTQQIDAKDRRQIDLDSELRAKSSELDSLRNQVSVLSGKASEESARRADVERRLESERLSSSNLASDLTAKINRIDELTSQLNSLTQLRADEAVLRDATEHEQLLNALTLQLEEKNAEIQSLGDQVNILNSVKRSLQLASENSTLQLEDSRAEVELLLAKVDNLNARIACHYSRLGANPSNCLPSRKMSSGLACCSKFSAGGQELKQPLLDATSRTLINRRIAQLEVRIQQLDEPVNPAEIFLWDSTAQSSGRSLRTGTAGAHELQSPQSTSGRIKCLDDRIQQLIGSRPNGPAAFGCERTEAAIVTSTPAVPRSDGRASDNDTEPAVHPMPDSTWLQ